MQLTPGQLSTLDEIGIPVWELRGSTKNLESTDAIELTEQQLQADLLIVYPVENHTEQKQQLLAAMLSVIEIAQDRTAIISKEQLPNLTKQSHVNKLILVFGQQFQTALTAEKVVPEMVMHELSALSDSGLNAIVTHDLSELIQHPEMKADVWRALRTVQNVCKQFN